MVLLKVSWDFCAYGTNGTSYLHSLQELTYNIRLRIGLIRVALLLYPPPTRPLGPLPDPYPIPRGYLIHTGQKIK